VDKVDNIGTNGCLKDSRKRNSASDIFATIGIDIDDRSGSGLKKIKQLI
jgi:hypothetical protein